MIIDNNVVRSLQKESLEEYCLLHNVSVDDFARRKYDDYKDGLNKLEEHQNVISNLFIKHTKGLSSPSVDAVLDMDYDFSESYRRGALKDIDAFFSKNKFSKFLIDVDTLRATAKEFEVDIQSNDWMLSYIERIPMIILYTPFIEAYVQRIPNSVPRIVVSNSLAFLFESGIIPLLINHIFTIKKTKEGHPSFHLLPNSNSPSDLSSTGDMIIDMARFYLGQIPLTRINFRNIPKSEAYPIFGTPLGIGIQLFTVFHEFSHVIYSHLLNQNDIKDEAFADNLAVHILIERTLNELKSHGLESSEATLAFFRVYSFQLLAPVILMNFTVVMQLLLDEKNPPTHPHPSIRSWYLKEILMTYFKNRPPLKEELDKVYSPIGNVFDYIYAKLGGKNKGMDENDLQSIMNINLPVSFLE